MTENTQPTNLETSTNADIPRKGYMLDANGAEWPTDKVKPIDRDRDRLVKKLANRAKKVSGTIADFKADAFADIADFVAHSAAQYDHKFRGKKGNMTLFSFDGQFKIIVARGETRAFDERLQVAKSMIDDCIKTRLKRADKLIQSIVNDAFQVDKEGKVSIDRIMGLRRIKEDDPQWLEAMEAIADSIKIIGSKRYIRLYERVGETEQYVPISLDVASV